MEFGVLGPLRVVDGDRSVAVGGPMQRAVLALLILEPNRVVSMQQLSYGLWGDDPPPPSPRRRPHRQPTGSPTPSLDDLFQGVSGRRQPGIA